MILKNSNSPFKKEKSYTDAASKKWLIIIGCALAVILIGSVVAILAKNDFDLRSALSGEIVTTKENEETTVKTDIAKSDRYYLLYCFDDDTNDLRFMWVVRLKLPSRAVTVFAPNVQTMTSVGDDTISFNYTYKTRGTDALKIAVENEYGIEISKYAGSGTKNFKSMINYMGGITLDVPEKVEYRDQFNLFLIKGKNTVKGDPVYKYLIWLGFGQAESISRRSDVLVEIFSTVFTQANSLKTDAYYSKFANSVETDFTIVDYRKEIETVKYVFENGISKVTVAQNENELTGKK